jgi:hypothetical protein
MKIMISNDGPTAHYYIRKGWAQAFTYAGHDTVIWNIKEKPAFEAFRDFEPDILITQTYNLDRAIIKNIESRPHMFVAMRTGEYSSYSDQYKNVYPILNASEEEVSLIRELRSSTGNPNFLFSHYHQDDINITHKKWDVPCVGLMNAANLFDYVKGKEKEEYKTDLCFVGGYWPYKAKTLDRYILPLCKDYKIRIFGNQPWNINKYYGFIPQEEEKHVLKSAKICLNVHEKHSQDLGYDVIERPFKLMSNKCFFISDYVERLHKIFPWVPMAKSPDKFQEIVDFWLKDEQKEQRLAIVDRSYRSVLDEHTYFDRCSQIFSNFGLYSDAINMIDKKKELIERAGL